MSFHKILVALDRSVQSPSVLEAAIAQARQFQSSLCLVHTVRRESDVQTGPFLGIGTIADIDTYGAMKRIQQEHLQKELDHARAWLQDCQNQAERQGLQVESDCRVGEPSQEICHAAQDWGADLVVIGRRGHQGLSEIVLGSVSNYVVHHAPCSVLVVQGIIEDSGTPRTEDA
jgi:nucleotide-binding universal stress UspA family protein